jgi:hypothetical protein
MWRCRNSAVEDRHALQSDYTDTNEKNTDPTNGACTSRPTAACDRSHHDAHDRNARRECAHRIAMSDAKNKLRENPYAVCILAESLDRRFCCAIERRRQSSTARVTRKSRRCVGSALTKKNFPQTALQGHCIDDETIKTSESVSDSIRQSLTHKEVGASATRVNDNHRPTFE